MKNFKETENYKSHIKKNNDLEFNNKIVELGNKNFTSIMSETEEEKQNYNNKMIEKNTNKIKDFVTNFENVNNNENVNFDSDLFGLVYFKKINNNNIEFGIYSIQDNDGSVIHNENIKIKKDENISNIILNKLNDLKLSKIIFKQEKENLEIKKNYLESNLNM